MLYRRFGRTELQMPVFSCGGMRYQQGWKDIPLSEIEEKNQANLEATIRRSIEVGINHIETARGYGPSERQLGLVLPKFPREKIIVQTKIGLEDDSEVFRSNFMDSLGRLNLDHVDLLAIHGINDEADMEKAFRKGGCLEVVHQIQDEGLARHVGFSTHGPAHVIVDSINTNVGRGFDYVNLHWYYINQANWPAIEAATARDMGVFIISPTDKGGMLYKPPAKLVDLTAPLHPIIFNDLFCLSHPEVHTLSLGAAKPSDFDLHLEAISLYDRREEFLPPILERLEREMEATLGREYTHNWRSGLPRWQEVPGEINIEVTLGLYNLARAYDMVEYGRMRYNLMGNAGAWFPGQMATKVDDGELAPVLKDSPFADRIPAMLRDAHEMLKKDEPVKRLSES
ncbi:MAG: aldo/keto reductase [Candidatus Sumerlaeia bacterium]|nr:aldo/keto reductase [Candidatus Sumerlaeia bacterium]